MSSEVKKIIDRLRFGDRIDVFWYDASEATGIPPRSDVDIYVHSTGFFLAVKGKKRKHLVLAKEVIDSGKAYHYNSILLTMIDRIDVVQKDALAPGLKRRLRKFVKSLPTLKEKDGWAYKDDNYLLKKSVKISDRVQSVEKRVNKLMKKHGLKLEPEKKPKKLTQAERISSLELRVAVLEEKLQNARFLEKIVWVLLATSLGKIVLEIFGVLG